MTFNIFSFLGSNVQLLLPMQVVFPAFPKEPLGFRHSQKSLFWECRSSGNFAISWNYVGDTLAIFRRWM